MSLPAHLRERLADFRLGAPVHSSDDRHVGSLHRVVVDRESWDPHQIIVKETALFSGHALAVAAGLPVDELIVPLTAIARVAPDRVDLALTSTEVRRLPPYLSYHYEGVDARELAIDIVSNVLGALRLPPAGEEADKAPGDIEIRKGENVMLGHNGHRLGQVREVLVDGGELVGIVVHPVGLFQSDVVIQVRFLDRSDDGALFVQMSPDDLKHLHRSAPGSRW